MIEIPRLASTRSKPNRDHLTSMNSHAPRSAIVLNVDGLRPDMLGPYGNSWIETPQFNRLAAESLLWESCISACPDRLHGWISLVTGRHPLHRNSPNQTPIDSLTQLYLTDRTNEIESPTELGFDQIIQIEPGRNAAGTAAQSIERTGLGRFFAEAIDWIERAEGIDLFWLDCQAMSGPWDAPPAYRDALRDSEDPEPPAWIDPPSQQFHLKSDDPDLLLGYQLAYGAQIMVLDQCLGVLLDALAESGRAETTLFCLTSTRGYPLGEHGVVGYYRPTLFKESIHVPLFVRFPSGSVHPGRSQVLVQPSVLPTIVGAWFDSDTDWAAASRLLGQGPLPASGTSTSVVSITHPTLPRLESIVTHDWKMIRGAGKKLFVRPDDLWEFNDVHELCSGVVAELATLLDARATDYGR